MNMLKNRALKTLHWALRLTPPLCTATYIPTEVELSYVNKAGLFMEATNGNCSGSIQLQSQLSERVFMADPTH